MQAMESLEDNTPGRRSPGFPARADATGCTQAVRASIERHGADVQALDRELVEMAVTFGARAWATALGILCRLDLSPREARRHWKAVVAHTSALARALGRPVDYRIALADYFVAIEPRYQHPVVVDQRTLEDTETGSVQDWLTGLYNYRFLEHALPRELHQARRIGYPLAAVFLDVDDFKAYNDRFGHAAGNDVLLAVADTVRGSIRESDLACRYGGEELVVVLPDTDRFGAFTVARRIIERLAALAISTPASAGVVTLSAGVAAFPADADQATELLRAADAALYRAKASGKNRVELYSTERRAHARVPSRFTGFVPGQDHDSLRLDGRDLSESGLYFVTPERLPVGHSVRVVLDLPEPAAGRVSAQARVVRCECLPGDRFGVGAAITRIAQPDRLVLQRAVRPPS